MSRPSRARARAGGSRGRGGPGRAGRASHSRRGEGVGVVGRHQQVGGPITSGMPPTSLATTGSPDACPSPTVSVDGSRHREGTTSTSCVEAADAATSRRGRNGRELHRSLPSTASLPQSALVRRQRGLRGEAGAADHGHRTSRRPSRFTASSRTWAPLSGTTRPDEGTRRAVLRDRRTRAEELAIDTVVDPGHPTAQPPGQPRGRPLGQEPADANDALDALQRARGVRRV